jgi:hypothetical protein
MASEKMLLLLFLVALEVSQALRLHKLSGGYSSKLSAVEEAKLGWDSHQAIDAIPDSLVRTIDGNESLRRKFEALCRNAQVFSHDRFAGFIYSFVLCTRQVFALPLKN